MLSRYIRGCTSGFNLLQRTNDLCLAMLADRHLCSFPQSEIISLDLRIQGSRPTPQQPKVTAR